MKDLRDYKPVRDFLLETEIYDQLEEVAKTHRVPEERIDEFLHLTDAVVKGELPLDQMPVFIQKAFALEEDFSKKLAADLAGHALLPLENYLPEVGKSITEWGGDISNYPKKRVGKEETSPERFVEDLMQRLDLRIPESLTQRFTYLAAGYLTGDRTKESTKRILMRKLNIGGLEFTEPMTDRFFEVLDREGKHFDLSEEKEPAPEEEKEKPLEEALKETEEVADEVKESQAETPEKPHKPSRFLPVVTPLPVVSPKGRSVPDHAAVFKKKPFMTREQMLERIKGMTIHLPKKVKKAAKATKIAAKQTFGSEQDRLKDLRPSKQDVEKEVNMLLAPVVETFREKGLASIAFRDIAVGYLKEERDAEQTKEQLLTRHGFNGSEADAILQALAKAKQVRDTHVPPKVKILGKKTPVQKERPIDLREKEEKMSHELATSVPIISGIDLFDHEEEEVKSHKQKVEKHAAKKPASSQEQIDALLAPAIQIFKKNKIEKKLFDDLAGAHVRGIREARQTESLLKDRTRLSEKDRLFVMRALNAARRVAEGEHEKKQVKDNEKEALARKERAVLNRRHAAVTGTVPKEGVHPVMPTARVSAARTKEEELAMQHAIVSDEEIISAQSASRPKQAKAKVTKKSIQKTGKKVTDVTFERRLAGPVEELGTMTIADFRRLSPDPKESVRKIFDKLALLEVTSYEQRIAGVRAWRKSGVNKLYLEMSREALQAGKSVAEIAADRRNSGKESLSPNEVQAIVDLNSRIKF